MKTKIMTLCVAAFMAAPIGTQAAEVTLRLSYWVPATIAPAKKGIIPWAKDIEKESNGRIKVETYPAQQLGHAADHYDMARDGIVDIAWVNPGYSAGRFPIFSLSEVPFNVADSIKGAKAIHEWYLPYAAKEMSDVKFCVAHPHGPGALHSKVQIRVPSDIAGKNIRPAHATMARFVTQLGGAPISVSAPEVREALARGTADAVTLPWGAQYDFNLTNQVKYHLDMPFYISTQILVINKKSYAALSPANKKVIDDHCTPDWSAKIATGWAEDDAAARLRLKADKSHTFYEPTPAEVGLWRDAAKGVLQAWKADIAKKGLDADAIYAGYIASLEKNGAKY